MDNASRFPATGSKRRLSDTGAVPMLAQLPDMSSELPIARALKKTKAQDVDYRFDGPQMADHGMADPTNDRASQFRTLKSELAYSPGSARLLRPHVFDKSRPSQRRRQAPRRESQILPRSNSFAIPRRGILDSLVPAIRFAMLVVFFTAAGTWIQLTMFQNQGAGEQRDTTKISIQRPAPGASKTVNRPTQSPTAVGPVGTTPESATRVGRVREKNDFATLRGDIMPIEPMTVGSSLPELAGPGLPQLQITEPPKIVVGDESSHQQSAGRPTEVARVPGFSLQVPSR